MNLQSVIHIFLWNVLNFVIVIINRDRCSHKCRFFFPRIESNWTTIADIITVTSKYCHAPVNKPMPHCIGIHYSKTTCRSVWALTLVYYYTNSGLFRSDGAPQSRRSVSVNMCPSWYWRALKKLRRRQTVAYPKKPFHSHSCRRNALRRSRRE